MRLPEFSVNHKKLRFRGLAKFRSPIETCGGRSLFFLI